MIGVGVELLKTVKFRHCIPNVVSSHLSEGLGLKMVTKTPILDPFS